MRDLKKYYKICLKELNDMGISFIDIPDINLTVSKRAKNRYGQCKSRNGIPYEINISQFLLDETITPDENALKNTLIHEILHAMCPGEGHKGEWRRLANLVTKKSNGLYHIKRTTSYEEKGIDYNLVNPPAKREKIKYIVECPVCGREWKYKRKGDVVKFPGLYVCTKCDANLRLKNIGVNAIM